MINFFKKTINKKKLCVNLTEANDCRMISELRQLQKELDEVENKINKLKCPEEIDLMEVMKFFSSPEIYHIYRFFNVSCSQPILNMSDILQIQLALRRIDNFDKFIGEIRTMYDREHLIAEERKKAAALRSQIDQIKNILEIK